MFFNDYIVFIYIMLFVILYNMLKRYIKIRAVNNPVIILGSLLVLLTVVNEHSLIILAVLSLLVFLGGKLLQKKKSKLALGGMLLSVIILYCIRNYPFIQYAISESLLSFINEPLISVQKLGISYILFRQTFLIL